MTKIKQSEKTNKKQVHTSLYVGENSNIYQWLKAQNDKSASLGFIIEMIAKKYGIKDIFKAVIDTQLFNQPAPNAPTNYPQPNNQISNANRNPNYSANQEKSHYSQPIDLDLDNKNSQSSQDKPVNQPKPANNSEIKQERVKNHDLGGVDDFRKFM